MRACGSSRQHRPLPTGASLREPGPCCLQFARAPRALARKMCEVKGADRTPSWYRRTSTSRTRPSSSSRPCGSRRGRQHTTRTSRRSARSRSSSYRRTSTTRTRPSTRTKTGDSRPDTPRSCGSPRRSSADSSPGSSRRTSTSRTTPSTSRTRGDSPQCTRSRRVLRPCRCKRYSRPTTGSARRTRTPGTRRS
jgi:hypothetical protein